MPTQATTDLIPKTIIMPQQTRMDSFKEVRTRMAPSPTGFLHIGNLRTALYAYLVAKHYKGKFLIRIEDTDRARLVQGAINNIFEILNWADINPDEYPIFNEKEEYQKDKGNVGPYVQSKRLDIYKKYAEQLINEGKAYYCFCTPERLEKMRAEQAAQKMITHYDKACRCLSAEEVEKNLKNKISHVIRFRSPDEGETLFDDLIRGTVTFKNRLVDDYILLKSDGYPTYHLASVIDDHLMEISHVIRGEEWLPSAPIHKFLYNAFGWNMPHFAHLPSILGTDKKKLSKRTGDVAVSQYIEKGYLPEAIINFILLLGWNPGTDKEIFNREEMIAEFSLDKVGKSGAIFDPQKLDWMNGNYIRSISLDKLTQRCIPYLIKTGMIEEITNDTLRQAQGDNIKNNKNKNVMVSLSNHSHRHQKYKIIKTGEEVSYDWIKKVISLEQERMKKLSDIIESTKYFFVDVPEYDADLLKWRKSTIEQTKLNLIETKNLLKDLDDEKFNKSDLESALKPLTEKLGVGDTLWPLRVALSGTKFSPGPHEIAEALGKDKILKRLEAAIEKIG